MGGAARVIALRRPIYQGGVAPFFRPILLTGRIIASRSVPKVSDYMAGTVVRAAESTCQNTCSAEHNTKSHGRHDATVPK